MTAREEIETVLGINASRGHPPDAVQLVAVILMLADRIDELDRLTHGGRSDKEYFDARNKAAGRR